MTQDLTSRSTGVGFNNMVVVKVGLETLDEVGTIFFIPVDE
nr:hypothetical protein [Nitrospira sp. KM1]